MRAFGGGCCGAGWLGWGGAWRWWRRSFCFFRGGCGLRLLASGSGGSVEARSAPALAGALEEALDGRRAAGLSQSMCRRRRRSSRPLPESRSCFPSLPSHSGRAKSARKKSHLPRSRAFFARRVEGAAFLAGHSRCAIAPPRRASSRRTTRVRSPLERHLRGAADLRAMLISTMPGRRARHCSTGVDALDARASRTFEWTAAGSGDGRRPRPAKPPVPQIRAGCLVRLQVRPPFHRARTSAPLAHGRTTTGDIAPRRKTTGGEDASTSSAHTSGRSVGGGPASRSM